MTRMNQFIRNWSCVSTKSIVSALRSAKTDHEGRKRAKTAALLSLAYLYQNGRSVLATAKTIVHSDHEASKGKKTLR